MRRLTHSPWASRGGTQCNINGEIACRVLLALVMGLQFGCGFGSEDDAARKAPEPLEVSQRSAPLRIVSLSALATRFVVELGVGHQLVGVDAQSSSLLELTRVPVLDLQNAHQIAPDLVLIPGRDHSDEAAVNRLESVGAKVIEFDPHDLEDVFALCRDLGTQLVGITSASLFERRIARPLSLVAGISPPRGRLRVVAVVGIEPLELAGGHSFQTDLIEIAGGSSVTHGGDDVRIKMTPGRWDEFSPDLVIVTTAAELSPAEEKSIRARIPDHLPIEFFAFDPESFWLEEPERDAERLRVILASIPRKTSD
jgi:ABC-type Fe3+-hydroxamate transport system substrate-binding protein